MASSPLSVLQRLIPRPLVLRRRVLARFLLAAPLLAARSLGAQTPAPSVEVSDFGVDTTDADVGAIVRLLRAYLATPDTSAVTRGLWATSDLLDRRVGDLHRGFAYQGFPATIIGVISVAPGDSVYVAKLIHATADTTGREIRLLALQRLYAVRAPNAEHGWQLSNALPRLTRDWRRQRAGSITFHYAPGQHPSADRANRAVRFVDSIAALFAIPAPSRIDYYVTSSHDEYLRALGLDFFPLPSGPGTATGGRAITEAGIVLAGDPSQGEAYFHELVHVVLRGHLGGGFILGEGVPTWLGGSKGRPAREMYRVLAAFQETRPDVTLEALVRGTAGWGPQENDARSATGALFVETVHRRAGIRGVRALAATPMEPGLLLEAMASHLGLPRSDPGALERWWRHAAPRAAERP